MFMTTMSTIPMSNPNSNYMTFDNNLFDTNSGFNFGQKGSDYGFPQSMALN